MASGPGGSTYSNEFIQKFQKAQGERNNRLIKVAQERLHALEKGEGRYADDEPFLVAGGDQSFFSNKLYPQDIRLLSHTRKAWPLVHADGSITTQIVPSVRRATNDESLTNSSQEGRTQDDRSHLSQLLGGLGDQQLPL